MKFGRTNKDEDRDRIAAAKKVQHLHVPDIIDWADATGSQVAKALDDFRRTRDPLCVEEAKRGISYLQGFADVLLDRTR